MNGLFKNSSGHSALKTIVLVSAFILSPLFSRAWSGGEGSGSLLSMTIRPESGTGEAGNVKSAVTDWSGTHEINANIGFPVLKTFYSGSWTSTFFLPSLNEALDDTEKNLKGMSSCPSLGLEYGYNIKKWLNVGGGVYYTNVTIPRVYKETGQFAGSFTCNFTQVMANVKFYWFNSEWVRLYSSVGAGICISDRINTVDKYERTVDISMMCDLRLLGITVGKKFYGNFQFGTITTGFVTAGIGYRF